MSPVYVIMGVAASGKTTVGVALAQKLNCPFYDGDFDLIWQRIVAHQDHYMKESMLHSQFQTLEEPTSKEALIIDISDDPQAILNTILT